MAFLTKLKEEIRDLKGELIELRRDFHMYPELGFKEVRTSKKIAKYLEELGLEVRENIAHTGVVSILEGYKEGKTVMLRSDMDALPIEEQNDVPYRSQNKGVMHACGHDGHMAMLLVAPKILSKHKSDINGKNKAYLSARLRRCRSSSYDQRRCIAKFKS